MTLLRKSRSGKAVCRFWTCKRFMGLQSYTAETETGESVDLLLCKEHEAIVIRASEVPNLLIRITPENWLWIDTYSWHLAEGAK